MKIAVFTDLHYEAGPHSQVVDPDASLKRGLAHVQSHVFGLDLVVFCGDLTHEGKADAYAQLKRRLRDLKVPYVLMIGNHDRRDAFQSAFPGAPKDEAGFVQHFVDTPSYRLVFLDTLNGPPYEYPKYHIGHLCVERLNWLRQVLRDAGEKPCIVFMHHPPHNTGFASMDYIKLVNGAEFYDVIEETGNVQHIVCGHIHRTISGSHRGVAFSIFKSTVGQMPMIFNMVNAQLETDEPPAYGILELNAEGVCVHTEDYGLTDLTVFTNPQP